jgi:hypothetical protein
MLSGFLFHRGDRLLLLATGILAAIFVATMLALMGPGLQAHIDTLALALSASGDSRLSDKVGVFFGNQFEQFVVLVGLVLIVEQYRKEKAAGAGKTVAALAAAALMSLVILFNNHEIVILGGIFVFVVFFRFMSTLPAATPFQKNIRFLLGALPLAIFLGSHMFNDIMAIGNYGARSYMYNLAGANTGTVLTAQGIHLLGDDAEEGFSYPMYDRTLTTIVAHIRENHGSEAKVLAGDFSNPYPWLLGSPSPRGTILSWYDAKRTFSLAHHPAAETTLHDVDILVDHKWTSKSRLKPFWTVYADYIEENFTVERDEDDWRILVRRQASR